MSYPIYYIEQGDVLYHFFGSYDGATGASEAISGLAVTDIEIYKDGSVTQRSSDAGYALLDTDGIDFDSLVGINGFSIDLNDNTDAGFYAVGPWYHVVIASITADGQTVNFVACAFRIVSATRGLAGTALPNAAADAAGGLPISDAGGLDLDAKLANTNEVTAARMGALTDWINGGRLDLILDDILLDTGTTLDGKLDTIDNFLDTEVAAILEDTGTTLQAELDGIQADTEDIQARLPAALTAGGNIKADMLAISGDATAADRLEALMDGVLVAQVNDAAATTTAFAADGFTEATDDHFNGRLVTFVSGALLYQQTAITDYDAAGHAQGNQAIVVTALTEAPADDVFMVIH